MAKRLPTRVLGCVGNIGLIKYEIRRGSFKKHGAIDFICNTLQKAQSLYWSPVVMVIYNAPCHSSIK